MYCILRTASKSSDPNKSVVPCGTSSQPRWVLSIVISFESSVKIKSYKFLCFAKKSTDGKVTILWILGFSVSLQGIRISRLHTFPISCNALIVVCWQHPNSIYNYWLVIPSQRLQQSSKIDDRGLEGVQCTGVLGEIFSEFGKQTFASPFSQIIISI